MWGDDGGRNLEPWRNCSGNGSGNSFRSTLSRTVQGRSPRLYVSCISLRKRRRWFTGRFRPTYHEKTNCPNIKGHE